MSDRPAYRIASSESDAWEQIDELAQCHRCIHYNKPDLFGCGWCQRLTREVSCDNVCECFYARLKKDNYWIHKLVAMALDYSGGSDFFRRLDYHEANGTADKFLKL